MGSLPVIAARRRDREDVQPQGADPQTEVMIFEVDEEALIKADLPTGVTAIEQEASADQGAYGLGATGDCG